MERKKGRRGKKTSDRDIEKDRKKEQDRERERDRGEGEWESGRVGEWEREKGWKDHGVPLLHAVGWHAYCIMPGTFIYWLPLWSAVPSVVLVCTQPVDTSKLVAEAGSGNPARGEGVDVIMADFATLATTHKECPARCWR